MTTTPATQALLPVTVERDPLALAMLAAWANVEPDNLPPEMRAPADPHTMASWRRVGEAALSFFRAHSLREDDLREALRDSQATLSAIKAECVVRCEQEEDQMAAHIVEICLATMTTNAAALTPSAVSGDAGEGRDQFGNSAEDEFEAACLGISHKGAGE